MTAGSVSRLKKHPVGSYRLMMSNVSPQECNILSPCFIFTPLPFPHLHHYLPGCSQGVSTSHCLDPQVVWGGVIELADLLSSIWVKQLIYYTGGFVITNYVHSVLRRD